MLDKSRRVSAATDHTGAAINKQSAFTPPTESTKSSPTESTKSSRAPAAPGGPNRAPRSTAGQTPPDQSASEDVNGGGMPKVSIDRQAIAWMMREIQHEFDEHPIRVPVHADPPLPAGSPTGSTTTIYNGPVIHGDANGAQLAWGNETVYQTQTRAEQIAPGFEVIAQAVAKTLERLPSAGLAEDDQQDAEAAARDVLVEVTQSAPDRGKIRRALASLKGFLAPIAMSLAEGGAEESAHEWPRMAVEQLSRAF
jgi:hypothetical protein